MMEIEKRESLYLEESLNAHKLINKILMENLILYRIQLVKD